MCFQIIGIIKSYNPTDVVIEEMPSTRNAVTTRMLSKIIGAVYYHCITSGIPYEEISCAKWRSTLGINKKGRDAVKQESIERVNSIYRKDVDDNEADAINIGDAYCICKNIKKERN